MYFKKGIDDAASEWAQHHAKRWLDTSGKARPHLIPLFTLLGGLSRPYTYLLSASLGLRSMIVIVCRQFP